MPRIVGVYMCLALLQNIPCSSSAPPPGILGDYNAEIREAAPRADGKIHVNSPLMIERLNTLHVNTYFFLIWHSPSDWDDLRNEFLPASARAGIGVWAYLVPPKECKPACSLPFGNDYVRWAAELARMSLDHPNLKGMVIDDFDYNAGSFPPAYAIRIRNAAKAVNPKFLFYPLLYWTAIQSPSFLASYSEALDGFIFAYRDDPQANTLFTESLPGQLATTEAKAAAHGKPFLLMAYAAPMSGDPPPSAEYVRTVVDAGLTAMRQGRAAGVITYSLDKHEQPRAESASYAHHGSGYGVIFVHGQTAPGAHGDLSCRITIDPQASSYVLTFWHRGTSLGVRRRGVLFKQVLVDKTTVWEEDAADEANAWKSETVDLAGAVNHKDTATLRFSLTNRIGGDVRLTAEFDDLGFQGVAAADPDFENPRAWATDQTNLAFRELVEISGPDRLKRAFGAVSGMFGQSK